MLEELTNGRGFHRAFLLDACRTDVFAGVELRGAETRDLALVTLPDVRENPGTCSVLRSCDKFCPALEFDDLGHGVFTQAVLGVVEDNALRALPFGEPFVASVRDRMRVILRDHAAPADQTPAFQTNGAPFPLFELPVGRSASLPTFPSPPALVICPICGKKNEPKETFRCRECGRDNLCLRHQDEATYLCTDCAARKAREEEARQEAARKAEAERKAREWIGSQPGERRIVHVGSQEIALRWCPPGTFIMGSPTDEEGRSDDETQHEVTLKHGFWMGETPVTQGLWKEVMGVNPSSNTAGDDYPVENVSWTDCQMFLTELNSKSAKDFHWALPTEAQWEYACRAGSTTAYCWGDSLNGRKANCDGRYPCGTTSKGPFWGRTTPVCSYAANDWGLYDMHGNVWEWCADWYGAYPANAITDPVGPLSGSFRVDRGGSCFHFACQCRSANRVKFLPDDRDYDLGLRIVSNPL